MIVLTANICFDGLGGSVFEDQVDHFSVDKVRIRVAAKRQQKHAKLSPAAARRSHWRDLIRQLRLELGIAEERNKSLLRCLQLVEANAARLGIDPEELFVPLPKPDRSISKTCVS